MGMVSLSYLWNNGAISNAKERESNINGRALYVQYKDSII